jgi:glycosyltransferase involved in cell wall biosynthesis
MLPFLRDSGDDVIAMSDFNYDYFRSAFPSQGVYKITYPFRFKLREATSREDIRARYGMKMNDFVVFFNFDFGSYYRKNIPSALKAFARAFRGDANAKLLFKTKGAKSNRKQVGEMMECAHKLGIVEQFIHIPHYLPRADVDGLTAACDVYLSLHKSEGFGIGMAEAMSQGKPVVATNWSANTEFCRPDTAWCVPYRLVPILPYEYPVEIKEWAEVDVDAAAVALKEIRADPAAAAQRAARGRMFMEVHFSVARFKADVEKMLADHGSAITSAHTITSYDNVMV